MAAGSTGIDFILERRGAIEGQVIDALTGQPIERFRITHFPEPYTPFYPGWERDLKEQSDPNGAFRIANVTPGAAKVVVLAEGYLQADVDVEKVLTWTDREGCRNPPTARTDPGRPRRRYQRPSPLKRRDNPKYGAPRISDTANHHYANRR